MDYRAARPQDAGALAHVFFRAVREGAASAYTCEERAAWAPKEPEAEAWQARIAGLTTVVAEDQSGIVGFMSLNTDDGDLDLAFVLPEAKGTGVAKALYAMIENHARSRKIRRLHTRASHLARPFFERQGWTVQRENQVERQGVTLTNWIMDKTLT